MSAARTILGPGGSGLLYQCSATFEAERMTIAAPEFPYMQLSGQSNQQKLRACAAQVYGQPVSVELVNSESSSAPVHATRSLDELKNFSVVKFK